MYINDKIKDVIDNMRRINHTAYTTTDEGFLVELYNMDLTTPERKEEEIVKDV